MGRYVQADCRSIERLLMRDWTKIGAIGNIALVVLNLINLIVNLMR